MTLQQKFNVLFYEIGLLFKRKFPSLARKPFFRMLMKHCLEDWTEWKTEFTMARMKQEEEQIQEFLENQWKTEKADRLAMQAAIAFPDAKVTPKPNATIPSVLIEYPDGSLRLTFKIKD